MPLPVGQRSLDELGQPLSEVTFCIVDVETTGGSPATGAVTEIGAVKLRGGECLGTFQSLINPGMPIPREITVLTGISAATVADAPPIRVALPGFLDFLGDAVFVGHNVRYDWSFLNAELLRSGLPEMANRRLDTLSLARRLIREEVPNCKLSTLAVSLRLDHQPAHRALDDALATGDLLHFLIERASSWGVLGLDDLIELPKIAGHPQAAKLRLTEALPHKPGVYLFRDRTGRVLYVGKATDLRSRVRSYFTGDSRRKIGQLLRETHAIDHEVCHHSLEASVREIRLIHTHEPRYNRHSTRWRAGTYLRLTDEAFPRFSIVRKPPPIGTFHLGPLPSTSFANRVIDAVQSVVELRRCKERIRFSLDPSDNPLPLDAPGRSARRSPCAPAQLGIASCPCSGQINQSDYADLVTKARLGLSSEPQILLEPLARQLDELAAQERFEEAVVVRDRGAVLAEAIRRQRRMDMWRGTGHVVVAFEDESGAALSHGVLTSSWGPGDRTDLTVQPAARAQAGPIEREAADELLCVASYMEHASKKITLEHVDGVLASPLPRLDRFVVRNPVNRER